MSERTAGFTFDAMVANGANDTEVGWETFALLEALDFDYERFCRVMDVDPDSPVVRDAYGMALDNYQRSWNLMGQAEFARTIADAKAKWERMLKEEYKLPRRIR